MNEYNDKINSYRDFLTQLDPTAEEALTLIKDGKHKEANDKIVEMMNRCSYSHPKGWAYMGILAVRQASSNSEISALQAAEKSFKKAFDLHARIFEGNEELFVLARTVFESINNYCDILRNKVKADTNSMVMQLTDESKEILENGYSAKRQMDQLNELQNRIDKTKQQGKIDASAAALTEIIAYEYFQQKVKELEAYNEGSIEISEMIEKNLDNIESFDKDYLVDAISSTSARVRELCSEIIAASRKAVSEKQAIEREEAIIRYWNEHPEEMAELNKKLEEAEQGLKDIDLQMAECDKESARISKKRKKFTSSLDAEIHELQLDLDDIEQRITTLGLFKAKEKKSLESQAEEIGMKMAELNGKAAEEKKAYNESIDQELAPITEKKKELAAKGNELNFEIKRLNAELTKNR